MKSASYAMASNGVVADTEEETLKALIEDKAVFSIKGRFLSEGCVFGFDKGVGAEEVSLYDDRVKRSLDMAAEVP